MTPMTLLRLSSADADDVPLEALHASLTAAVAAGDATPAQLEMLAALRYVDGVMSDGHLFYLARAGTLAADAAAASLASFWLADHAADLRAAIGVVAERDGAGALREPSAEADADERIEAIENYGEAVLEALAAADRAFYDDMTADDPEENPLLLALGGRRCAAGRVRRDRAGDARDRLISGRVRIPVPLRRIAQVRRRPVPTLWRRADVG